MMTVEARPGNSDPQDRLERASAAVTNHLDAITPDRFAGLSEEQEMAARRMSAARLAVKMHRRSMAKAAAKTAGYVDESQHTAANDGPEVA